jgi:LPS export ABC transporter protein LptC
MNWRTGAVLSLGALMLSAAACPKAKGKTQVKAKATKSAIPDSADQIIFGFRTFLTDQGISKGVLLADTALSYDDATRMELRRVNVTFYTSVGIRDGVLTAKAGTYNMRLSRLDARGDVVVVRDDGKRLTSQQLVYDQVRNQIFTDSTFILNEPSRTFTGLGFESDPQLTKFRCIRNCKGLAPVKIPTK